MNALPILRLARWFSAGLSVLLSLAVISARLPAQQKEPAKKAEKKSEPAKKEEPPKQAEKLIPPLMELKGHTDWVNQVVYNPDGSRLATASRDRTVRIWDAASGKELFTIKDNPGNVWSVAYSPDGLKFAWTSGKWDKGTKEWHGAINIRHAQMGKDLQALVGHSDEIKRVVFSPDGKWLASASKDKTVILWDAASGKAVHVLKGHGGEVEDVCFSPDSIRLASVGGVIEMKDKKTPMEIGELKIWDVASGKELASLKQGSRALDTVFYGYGHLLTGSYDGTLRYWDGKAGKEAASEKLPDGILAVAVKLNGKGADPREVACGGWDRTVTYWRAGFLKFDKLTFKGHTNSVTSLAFSPTAPHLASASLDQTVKIWNLAAPK
jgi:WD40 repeat protein